MARGKLRFREREVARLIRAAQRSGVSVSRVMVDQDGNLTVIAAEPEPEDHDGLTHEAAA